MLNGSNFLEATSPTRSLASRLVRNASSFAGGSNLSTQVAEPSPSEPRLQMLAFNDANGMHRLVWYSENADRPAREIVYLGYNDKGWSIVYDWTLTAEGWVANTTRETVFEYNQPIAEMTTTYSGGGGGSPGGGVHQQMLEVVAGRLGATTTGTVRRVVSRTASTPAEIAVQSRDVCGASAATGASDLAMYALSGLRRVRNATGGWGFPSPPDLVGQQALSECVGAIGSNLATTARDRLTYLGVNLAVAGYGIMWQLSDAARSAGTLFQGSLTGGGGGSSWTNSGCYQLVDQVSCDMLGRQGSHPY